MTRLFSKPLQKPKFTVWWEVHQATLEGEKIIAKSEPVEYDDAEQTKSKFSSLIAQLASKGWEPFATGRIEQMKRSGKSASAAERLNDLEGLHKASLISDEEYLRKRQEILSDL